MTAFSIHGRIADWVATELEAGSIVSGEEFGYEITMVPAQTPRGELIAWVILVTLRSPYLGQDAIGCTGQVRANAPAESAVRQIVRNSVAKLRENFGAIKAAGFPKSNGHNQAGLPPGLAGKRLG
jgi:hypothetical protein